MSKFLQNAAAAVNGTAPAPAADAPQAPAAEVLTVVDFPLDKLASETPAQTRVMLDVEKVNEYAKEMQTEEGLAEFMRHPIHLFEDEDGTVRISRGHTRVAAARIAGLTHYPAYVRPGDARAAKVHALGDNARHGSKRNHADLLHEIDMVLLDPELAKWSDREISRRVRCSHTAVGDRRRYWQEQGELAAAAERIRTDKHGNVSTINVANIGTANAARTAPSKPLDEQHTYSVIMRALAQSGTADVVSRFNWIREHDGPEHYTAPVGYVLDDATFARMWQRAYDELAKRQPKTLPPAGPQPAPQPTAQPVTAAPASAATMPANFVPAVRPGGVEWNKRQHDALSTLAVYLPECVEAVKTLAPLLGHTFDVKGYGAASTSLAAQVNDLLEAMEKARAGASEDGALDTSDNDGQD